jgi:hypothetical protein
MPNFVQSHKKTIIVKLEDFRLFLIKNSKFLEGVTCDNERGEGEVE